MLKPWQLIKELRGISGSNDKKALLANHLTEEFVRGATYAYNQRITYGVKKLPQNVIHSDEPLPWNIFEMLLQQLSSRELTGNNAKSAVESIASRSTEDQWNNWYARILDRDFKCGVSLSTLNSVFEDTDHLLIPEFPVQLAIDWNKVPHHFKGKKYMEWKLDGIRVIAHINVTEREVILYSRSGKVLENFPHVEAQLLKQFHGKLDQDYVFDGEIVSAKFNKLMTQVNRKYNVDADDAQFHIFDCLPADKFFNGYWECKLKDRKVTLANLFTGNTQPNLHLVPFVEVDLDTPEGQEIIEAENEKNLKFGFEGSMFKDPEADYVADRTERILKMKPWITVSLAIKGYKPGKKGTKNEKYFGSLLCEGRDTVEGVEYDIKVFVSGITDKLRKEIWEAKDKCLEQIVEIRADCVSQNKDGTYSLRFPRFKGFRGFEPGEKL